MVDGLVRFRDMIYVLNCSELKKLILREFHAKPYSGHLRYLKTLTAVKKFYYWPNLKMEVAEFVARYLDCLQVKVECKHPGGLLQPIAILEWKWEVISMDLITGPLRKLKQHDSIMVVVDKYIKLAHFIAVKTTCLASEVAQVFIRHIMRLHGVPKKIMSDRDAKFTSKFWKELFAYLGIEFASSTTYHPQTDGQKERVNRILGDMLRMYVMHQQKKLEYLPLVEFACNNGYQDSLRMNPFEAL